MKLPLEQVVLEGELVNMDVTSPAATVALGLMYLKTNDLQIAKLFVLPGKTEGASGGNCVEM